ncbi:hypothetical protein BCV00_17320 [Vibrio breoganii]|uniref:glycosyltransferase n=1 Tax=Vibrio breoganii TaxID=553239 RepID=UPI000C8377F4|nr:glycosyltransferase [Vibrio breoganii]PMG02423.1 hypothetical protein BCV00_17320 [Vibrio breoganii]
MVLFLVNRIGPYHHDRFEYLVGKIDFVVIEICGRDKTYKWDAIDCTNDYKSVTLFDNESYGLFSLAKKLTKYFFQFRPSHVFIPGWAKSYSLISLLLGKLFASKCIVMSDSTKGDKRRFFALEALKKSILKFFDGALVAGTRQIEYLKLLGFKKEVYTGYDVVNNTVFKNSGKNFQGDFIFIGRFIDEKNIILMLEAFLVYTKKIEFPRKLILVGDGHLRSAIEEFIKINGLTELVILKGFLQRDDIVEQLSISHSLILPSISETWGLVVNEALASFLPVIVSDKCGCCLDLVQGNGYLVDPKSKFDIVDKLLEFHNLSEEQYELMCQKSKLLSEQWSLEKYLSSVKHLSS